MRGEGGKLWGSAVVLEPGMWLFASSLIPTTWTWFAVPRSCLPLLPPPHDGSSTARRGLLDGSSISYQAIIREHDGSSTDRRRLLNGSSTAPRWFPGAPGNASSAFVETIIAIAEHRESWILWNGMPSSGILFKWME